MKGSLGTTTSAGWAGLVSSLESYFKSMAHGLIWIFFFQATLETLDWTQSTFILVSTKKVSIFVWLVPKNWTKRAITHAHNAHNRAHWVVVVSRLHVDKLSSSMQHRLFFSCRRTSWSSAVRARAVRQRHQSHGSHTPLCVKCSFGLRGATCVVMRGVVVAGVGVIGSAPS